MELKAWVRKLEELGLSYRLLGEKERILVLERGARVLAISAESDEVRTDGSPKSELRELSPFWGDPSELETGGWNSGGDRTWIGPEEPLFSRGVPTQLDPGSCRFTDRQSSRDSVVVEQEGTLQYDIGSSSMSFAFRLRKTISVAVNPLKLADHRFFHEWTEIPYAGYTSRTELTLPNIEAIPGVDVVASPACSLWSILQVPMGGAALVQQLCGGEPQLMFGDGAGGLSARHGAGCFIPYRGSRKFKLSFNALQSAGRFGYVRQMDDRRYSLVVRQFRVDPSGLYPDYPPGRPDETGSCMQFYFDGGQMGSFGELEYHAPAIRCRSGATAFDESQLWHYAGTERQISALTRVFLGMDLNAALSLIT